MRKLELNLPDGSVARMNPSELAEYQSLVKRTKAHKKTKIKLAGVALVRHNAAKKAWATRRRNAKKGLK